MIYYINALASTSTITTAMLFSNTISADKVKRSRLVCAVAAYAVFSLIMAFCYTYEARLFDGIALVCYPLRYIAVLLFAYRRIKAEDIYTLFLYELFITALRSSITAVLESAVELSPVLLSSMTVFVLNVIVIILICIFRDRISFLAAYTRVHIPTHLYILVLCVLLGLCGLSTLNNYSTEALAQKELLMNLLIVAVAMITGWVVISMLVNVISKQHLSSTAAILREQVEIQMRHYTKLEKINSEVRSFRHDYTNHLHSLHSLISMNENEDAVEYIEKLLDTTHKTYRSFCTGNKLADAILTDKSDMLTEGITIEYQGVIPESIDNTDLCVILSNALDNAIEACSTLEGSSVITVTAQERQGYFMMIFTNPTLRSEEIYDIPPTTKSDKKAHGMGLANIRSTANKYDGQMKIHCSDNLFELSVIMKI